MDNNLRPARVVTPGQILRKELAAREMTQKDLAQLMGRPDQMINEIINGKKAITADTAIQLDTVLGISSEFWMNLESKYQLHLARKNQEQTNKNKDIERRNQIRDLVPLGEIRKRNWIENSRDLNILEKEICNLLEITSLFEIPKVSVSFRHSQSSCANENYRIAWCKRVKQITEQNTIKRFQITNFQQSIPKILENSQKVNDIKNIPGILNEVGVHFIILPHLPKTLLDGATFFVGDNPVVALTNRYDRIDNFWFTLMHELGHIYAGHQGVFLDNLDKMEDNPNESEANKLASDWLISISDYLSFQERRLSKFSIQEFANRQGRHPGIIVGRLHHEGKLPFTHHKKFLSKIKHVLSDWTYQ